MAEKLYGSIMLVPSSFGQSLSAFVAQNIGAGRKDRSKRSMLYSMASSLCCGVVLAWLSFFHGDLLSGLFARDAEVVTAAADYQRAYAIDTLLTSLLFCFIGYFNGRGNTAFVMAQGIVGAFLVHIPVSLFMSRLELVSLFQVGLAGMICAAALTACSAAPPSDASGTGQPPSVGPAAISSDWLQEDAPKEQREPFA